MSRPSAPNGLQLPASLWMRLVCDPVLAAKVLLGYDLDIFQRARLRAYWWTPFLIDSSGYSTGKTIVTWIYCVLRALLIPNQWIGVFYPTGETGRNTFWNYFDECQSPILKMQLGRLTDNEDETGRLSKITRASACYKAYFLSGSRIYLPAPSFDRGSDSQSSTRYNVVHLEEWTHVDAAASARRKVSGIDKQIIGRATRPDGCWNKRHPLWSNHVHFSAPAKPQSHPAWKRFKETAKEADGIPHANGRIGGGDPRRRVVSFCYRDWSVHPIPGDTKSWREDKGFEDNAEELRRRLSLAEFLGEALGVWAVNGTGWYAHESILAAQQTGERLGWVPVLSAAMDRDLNLTPR